MNRHTTLLTGVVMAAALAISCTRSSTHATAALHPTAAVANAHGNVSAAQADDGNTELAVVVDRLGAPQRVVPGTSAYVVWVQPLTPGAAPQNVGVLGSFGHQNAHEERGELLTLTPLKSFDVMITPEVSAHAARPSNAPVMKAKVVR